MALVLVLALAGAMGRGVLSDEQLSVGALDTLRLETVTRRHSETELKLKIGSASGDSLVGEIARAALVYVALLLIFRIAGKHSLAEITTFDLVLTLVISEAIQEGMVDEDHSLTGAFLIVLTLVGLDIALAFFKQRSRTLDRILEGTPVLVLKDGRVRREAADKERVDESDILAAARRDHGLHRLDEIDYAVIERTGALSIIPKKGPAG